MTLRMTNLQPHFEKRCERRRLYEWAMYLEDKQEYVAALPVWLSLEDYPRCAKDDCEFCRNNLCPRCNSKACGQLYRACSELWDSRYSTLQGSVRLPELPTLRIGPTMYGIEPQRLERLPEL